MVRKNFLPRHSRRVAWQVPTVLVFPTILVRCGPRNAHAKGITNLSHEVLVFKCLSAQSRRRTLTILVAGRCFAVVAERFVLKTMLDVTRCCSSLCCLENVFVFVVLRSCKSDLWFRVGSFQRRALWPFSQPCGWLRGRWFGLFRFFLWFRAVCPLGMRACATTRTLRSSHNCCSSFKTAQDLRDATAVCNHRVIYHDSPCSSSIAQP